MIQRPVLIMIFLFLAFLAVAGGYYAIEVYEYTDIFQFNILQITALSALTLPLFLVETEDNAHRTGEENTQKAIDLSNRDPKADIKVVQDMAKQMLKTINEHIDESCTVMGFKETGLTYEIEWIINEDDFLKSYQEVAIIPYEKVHELSYWQEITRIIIRNNRLKMNPEQVAQRKAQIREKVTQQKGQSTKRSRTKTE